MRRFTTVSRQSPEDFLRDVGITHDQFLLVRDQLLLLITTERTRWPMKRRGKQSSQLTVEDKLLLTLTYLRHYATFQQLGQQFGISESYAYKIYDRYRQYLLTLLRVPGRKALLAPGLTALLLDVTEQPIERPIHRQRAYYSGKKKRHTIKTQLIVAAFSLHILAVACGPGRLHDFSLFKQTCPPVAPQIDVYADSGYQGISALHPKSATPIKKPKGRALTSDERAYNRALARLRIAIEHVNRRCKIFRIVKETYRGKHKHVGLPGVCYRRGMSSMSMAVGSKNARAPWIMSRIVLAMPEASGDVSLRYWLRRMIPTLASVIPTSIPILISMSCCRCVISFHGMRHG